MIVDDSLQFLPFGAMMSKWFSPVSSLHDMLYPDASGQYLVERLTLSHMLHFVPIPTPEPSPFSAHSPPSSQSAAVHPEPGVPPGDLWEAPVFVGKGSLQHVGEEVR